MMLYPFTAWSSHQISIYGKPLQILILKTFQREKVFFLWRSSSCRWSRRWTCPPSSPPPTPSSTATCRQNLMSKTMTTNQIYQRLSNRHCLLTGVFFKYFAKDIIHLIWSHRLTKLIHIKLLLLRTVRWKSLIMLLKSQM